MINTQELKFENNNDFLELFKNKLSDYTGAPYVVLTDSCSNAIFLSLLYSKPLYKDNYIIIPNRTYISVAHAIKHAGYDLNFRKKQWYEKYNIYENIWDYAVGFKKDMYIKGEVQCLSFQQKKALGIGKGGAILLDDYKMYLYLTRAAFDGRDASKKVTHDNIVDGWHMNMTPDQATKGILLLNQYVHKKEDLKCSYNYPDISLYFD